MLVVFCFVEFCLLLRNGKKKSEWHLVMILHYFRLGSGISACVLPMQSGQRKYAMIPEILGVFLSRFFSFFLGLKQNN